MGLVAQYRGSRCPLYGGQMPIVGGRGAHYCVVSVTKTAQVQSRSGVLRPRRHAQAAAAHGEPPPHLREDRHLVEN